MKIRYFIMCVAGTIISSILLIIPSFILLQYYVEYIGPLSGYYVSDRLENPLILFFIFFLPSFSLSIVVFYLSNRKVFELYGNLLIRFITTAVFLTPSIFLIYKGIKSVY